MTSLKEAFIEDHKIISQMIDDLSQTIVSNKGNFMEEFNDLRNAINKHIKEEEDIHRTIISQSDQFEDIIKSTKAQHQTITKILDDMWDYEDLELEELQHQMNQLITISKQHQTFEEEYLYHHADTILDEKEKSRIIYELESRIKQTR